MKRSFIALMIGAVLVASCEKSTDPPRPSVFEASGSITGTVDAFRQMLGQLNTTPGAASGRREINWDGVPDNLLNSTLPDDFFNPTEDNAPASRQRGLVYASGQNFQVSNDNFARVNAQAAIEFAPFSGNKTFANVSSKDWDVGFQVAGKAIPASVKGFGMVFSDVDDANSTSIEFFEDGRSLGRYFVLPRNSTSSFSFLGVYFPGHNVTRVQVSHQGILGNGETDVSQGGTKDLVIMDDFIYSEPVAR